MGKVIQFRNKEELAKEKRENLLQDWLEWEKWEFVNTIYPKIRKNSKITDFDFLDGKDETTLSIEDIETLAQEINYVHKKMMRNKQGEKESYNEYTSEESEWSKGCKKE